jgi:hypothetical protein
MHKFTIGQFVDLIHLTHRPAASGAYEIRNLLPATDASPDDPRYRIKGASEKYERVAFESELRLSRQPEIQFS